jgi:hypothetical protein
MKAKYDAEAIERWEREERYKKESTCGPEQWLGPRIYTAAATIERCDFKSFGKMVLCNR